MGDSKERIVVTGSPTRTNSTAGFGDRMDVSHISSSEAIQNNNSYSDKFDIEIRQADLEIRQAEIGNGRLRARARAV